MELRGLHRSTAHPPVHGFGGEREQMLNLNQRLETYLNRVKLLDEENAKLVREIQARREEHHVDLERRKFLDEELRSARLEVDEMWKERVYAEADVARLSQELQSLDLELRRETQAQVEARAMAEQSRRELEEERRAQMWLREKVNQLESEMKSLIVSHQEEVAHVEALLMQPRDVRPPPAAAAFQHGPNLLDLGQEYSQRAARAWQEAAQAYQGQLTRLEESVEETRQKLVRVNKETSEGALKLQNLDRELLGLQELRVHLEGTVDQQRESHCRDVQMLQEHLEDLEREKQALAQKMEQLLQENRGLMQMKMSLNMEVATYRALLDSDGLRGDISLQKQSRNIYSKDAVFSPWGVKDNYQTSPSPKITSTSLVRSVTGKTRPQASTATPTFYQKYVPRKDILDISKKKAEDKRAYQQLELPPYPKVLKDGAVENFRPQEVHEKVTYAEPLSPPDEQEGFKTFEVERDEDFLNDTVDQPSEEKPYSESSVSYQVEPSLHSEVSLEESSQLLAESALIQESSSFLMKSELLGMHLEKEKLKDSQAARFGEENATKSEPLCVESNLSHQVESPINEEPINEAVPKHFAEPFINESRAVTVKSETQEIPFENEEIEKPPAPIDAWVQLKYVSKTEQPYGESNLRHQDESVPNREESFNETSSELAEEPIIEESCPIAVKSEMQGIPFENEEIEKPQGPIDAWTEVEYVKKTEQLCEESNLSHQVESVYSTEELIKEPSPELVEEPFTDESCTISVKSGIQGIPFENEEIEIPHAPIGSWTEKESIEHSKDIREQQESTDSETEAIVEPNFDTKSSSPASEESPNNQLGDIIKEDFTFDSVGVSRDDVSPPKEKLYPDGEEMDTWDSVMEQNQDVKAENAEEPEEATRRQAEPEEDISAREAQQQQQHQQHQQDMIQDTEMEAKTEPQTDLEEINYFIKEEHWDKSQDDEQEDSQNVSVSWRTELEGDSYAQDNTLADTRPLIRYKSDDTDANTQASQVDDADDSSDSEQDEKVGEMLSGAWIEDKSRKFGTMEDLCEEAEGEVLDDEYDLEYLRKDGKDDTQVNSDDSQEEEVKTVVDVELDTDKLVEQELENLTTEWYTTQFALHQASTNDSTVFESLAEQPKAWEEALQDTAETLDMEDFFTIEAQVEQKGDELVEELKPDKEEEDEELAEVEGDKHAILMVTHCDTTEDITEVRKEFTVSSASQNLSFDEASIEQKKQENVEEELEEKQMIAQNLLSSQESQSVVDINQSDKPVSSKSEMQSDNGVEMRDTTPEDIFVPEEVSTEFPKVSTTEWEVEVEYPMENVGSDKNKIVKDLAQRGLSSDDKVDYDSLSPTDEPLNASPESVRENEDLFIVKDSKARLKTNGKANLDDLFSFGGNDDFWVSPLETGATYQPDVVDSKHAEWELGYGDVEARESEHLLSKSDMAFEQKEVTQIKGAAKGEIVHSEESEDDSEGMSSGEE